MQLYDQRDQFSISIPRPDIYITSISHLQTSTNSFFFHFIVKYETAEG